MYIKEYKPIIHDGVLALVKECSLNYGNALNTPELIVDFVRNNYSKYEIEEYVYLLAFNTKMKPLGFFSVSHGSKDSSIVDCKSVFTRTLLINASSIVLIHNHPSGDSKPSEADIKITEKLVNAGKILDIKVQDHIIIGDDNYFSFKEENIMPE